MCYSLPNASLAYKTKIQNHVLRREHGQATKKILYHCIFPSQRELKRENFRLPTAVRAGGNDPKSPTSRSRQQYGNETERRPKLLKRCGKSSEFDPKVWPQSAEVPGDSSHTSVPVFREANDTTLALPLDFYSPTRYSNVLQWCSSGTPVSFRPPQLPQGLPPGWPL